MKKWLFLIAGVALFFSDCHRAQTGNQESDEALAAFNAIVKANLNRKGYHDALKHWGLSLPGGAKFAWTKDTSANNIDFAMVIPADALIAAGLDIGRLDSGWVFQPISVSTDSGMGVGSNPNQLVAAYSLVN
jgi:hypothetical protein